MANRQQVVNFQDTVLTFYAQNGRHNLPWRLPTHGNRFDAYYILVSEVMLQQTQVSRVVPKYGRFLESFPSIDRLASAELADVIQLWAGLGYNRRAKYLHRAAQLAMDWWSGELPNSVQELIKLPGIGRNTAGAIIAYAFNEPVVFVETNIRSVMLHHFFAGRNDVSDKEVLALVEQTLPAQDVREWYWALMDYGTYLKQSVPNPSKASKHYVKQSPFEGSTRQIRGNVIRVLAQGPKSYEDLEKDVADARLKDILNDLLTEELIRSSNNQYHL